jgi:4-hydroxybenzoate polyprenyltransferase
MDVPSQKGSAVARMLAFVRFSHTVFALPFALASMIVAAEGLPPLRVVLLIVAAMVFARTAAMAFNRIADWEIDKRNPRTAGRHRLVSRPAAVALLICSAAAFVGVTWGINPLCFALSPVALVIVFFYSLTKRFTSYSHFFLGLALAVSPVGAWLAVTGAFALPPMVLAASVVFWVAGFDIIYATQDVDFDRKEGLHSLVVRLSVPQALRVAQVLHVIMYVILAAFGYVAGLGLPYLCAMVLILGALFYEHHVARQRSLDAVNKAFFLSNAFVGAVLLAGTALDVFLAK